MFLIRWRERSSEVEDCLGKAFLGEFTFVRFERVEEYQLEERVIGDGAFGTVGLPLSERPDCLWVGSKALV